MGTFVKIGFGLFTFMIGLGLAFACTTEENQPINPYLDQLDFVSSQASTTTSLTSATTDCSKWLIQGTSFYTESLIQFGDPSFVRFTLENQSLDAIHSWMDFSVVLSADATLDADSDIVLGVLSVDGLKYGESQTLTTSNQTFWGEETFDPTQTYYLGVILDSLSISGGGVTCDLSEYWNEEDLTTQVTFDLPDLYVEDLQVPEVLESGFGASGTYKLTNQATAKASDVLVSIYLHTGSFDVNQVDDYELLAQDYIPTLLAGTSYLADFYFSTEESDGSYSITAITDETDLIEEGDESNNQKNQSLDIIPDPPLITPTGDCREKDVNEWGYVNLSWGDTGDCFAFDLSSSTSYKIVAIPSDPSIPYSGKLVQSDTTQTVLSFTDYEGVLYYWAGPSVTETHYLSIYTDSDGNGEELGLDFVVMEDVMDNWEMEPNDTILQANAITLTSPITRVGGMGGYGEPSRQDFYAFNSGDNTLLRILTVWCETLPLPRNFLDYKIYNKEGEVIQESHSVEDCFEDVWFYCEQNTEYYISLDNNQKQSGMYWLMFMSMQ